MRLDFATVLTATAAVVYRVERDGSISLAQLLPADLERRISGVCVDSRTIDSDGLFVALKGERVDGHDYIAAAYRRGAIATLVSHLPSEPLQIGGDLGDNRFLLQVPDALAALGQIASLWRRNQPATIVGITGSIGKTTTKEIVSAMLGTVHPVLKSEANLNTEIGLPLMLLRLTSQHRVAVLEMGMYVTGDVELLARIAAPEIGIVTGIAPIHLERMGSIEAIAREKSRLIAALPSDGLAILNADDPWTRAMAEVSGTAGTITVGQASDADFRADDIRTHGLRGVSFTLHAEGLGIPFRTQVPGTHTINAFLAAAAVARRLGISWDDIATTAAEITLDARQRIVQLDDDMLIIDDSYNAAPLSMKAALDLLSHAGGERIAVLGDMLELGTLEEESHRDVGRHAAEIADWLVARGARSQWIADSAIDNGMHPTHVWRAATNDDALQALHAILNNRPEAEEPPSTAQRSRDWADRGSGVRWSILVKGSRGMEMETIVQALERGDT